MCVNLPTRRGCAPRSCCSATAVRVPSTPALPLATRPWPAQPRGGSWPEPGPPRSTRPTHSLCCGPSSSSERSRLSTPALGERLEHVRRNLSQYRHACILLDQRVDDTLALLPCLSPGVSLVGLSLRLLAQFGNLTLGAQGPLHHGPPQHTEHRPRHQPARQEHTESLQGCDLLEPVHRPSTCAFHVPEPRFTGAPVRFATT